MIAHILCDCSNAAHGTLRLFSVCRLILTLPCRVAPADMFELRLVHKAVLLGEISVGPGTTTGPDETDRTANVEHRPASSTVVMNEDDDRGRNGAAKRLALWVTPLHEAALVARIPELHCPCSSRESTPSPTPNKNRKTTNETAPVAAAVAAVMIDQ